MKTVCYATTTCLDCTDGTVVICVAADLTASGKPYIEGTPTFLRKACPISDCGPVFVYTLSYEEDQLEDPTYDLILEDITGVFCKNCLTDWVESQIVVTNPITVEDTASVDLTLSEEDVLSADVIIDPDEDNCLELREDGLFAPCGSGEECAAVYGQSLLAENFVVGSAFANVGISLNLSEAGDYWVSVALLWEAVDQEGGSDAILEVQLYDSTAAAVIIGSHDTIGPRIDEEIGVNPISTYSKTILVSVDEPSILQVQVRQPTGYFAQVLAQDFVEDETQAAHSLAVFARLDCPTVGGGGGGGAGIIVEDTESVNLTLGVGDPQVLLADVSISAVENNKLIVLGDGLFVENSINILDYVPLTASVPIGGSFADAGLTLNFPETGIYLYIWTIVFNLVTTGAWSVEFAVEGDQISLSPIGKFDNSAAEGTLTKTAVFAMIDSSSGASFVTLKAKGSGFSSGNIVGSAFFTDARSVARFTKLG